jgi:hypothetical protein
VAVDIDGNFVMSQIMDAGTKAENLRLLGEKTVQNFVFCAPQLAHEGDKRPDALKQAGRLCTICIENANGFVVCVASL